MTNTPATAVDDRWAWASRGNCVGRAELFFTPDDSPKRLDRRNEKRAKLLCATCPVQEECRRHALHHRERYGVWGGLTSSERHRIARSLTRDRRA